MLARSLMIAVAAAAAVWLGLWLHQTQTFDHARSEALAPGATKDPARIQHVASLFEQARRYTPDTLPLTAEALFLLGAGERGRATQLLERAVKREPRNVSAWALLGEADPARSAQARAEIARLNPLATRRR